MTNQNHYSSLKNYASYKTQLEIAHSRTLNLKLHAIRYSTL